VLTQTPSADLDACRSSAISLTIEDFAGLIGDVTGRLDLLDATIGSAGAANVEREFAIIAAEVRIFAAQVRKAADGMAAAVTASGRISGEVATALAGIKESIQHINDLIANAAAPDMTSHARSRVVPPPSLRN
jgi:hypothetical protein